MKKKIIFDKAARKELKKFRKSVRNEFVGQIKTIQEKGVLTSPEGKKISKNLFEIRIQKEGAYRCFYAYLIENSVVILHFFQKKSQRTPMRNIRTAKQRLKRYEQYT